MCCPISPTPVLIANEMRSPAVVNGFMKLVEKDFAVR